MLLIISRDVMKTCGTLFDGSENLLRNFRVSIYCCHALCSFTNKLPPPERKLRAFSEAGKMHN